MSLQEKVIGGVSWSVVSRLGSQFFQLGFTIVLARLLTPNDFGIIGMLVLFTGFAQVIGDSGFSTALVQKQDAQEAHYSTIFWVQLGIGLLLTLLFFFSGKYIAIFFSTPVLEPITKLLSLNFLISSLGYTQQAIFTKKFLFKKIAIINLASVFISGSFAMFFALQGLGVWALAWQILIGSTTLSLLYWLFSDWKPQLLFRCSAYKDLAHLGYYLLGLQSVNYWLRNGDNFLVAKFLGSAALGNYARAYNLMMLPLNNISAVMGQVMLPALSQIQTDIPRFKKAYLKSVQMIALVAFPVMAAASVLSEHLVLVILGAKWVEVIPVFRILCWVGLFQSIVSPVYWVFTSLGKTKVQFNLSLVIGVFFVGSILIGVNFGIIGVALAYFFVAVPSGILYLVISGRYINLSVFETLMSVSRILLISLMMAAVMAYVDLYLFHALSNAVRLFLLILVGGVIFVMLCRVSKNSIYLEALEIILKRKKNTEAINPNVS